jgi:hypothetical protein
MPATGPPAPHAFQGLRRGEQIGHLPALAVGTSEIGAPGCRACCRAFVQADVDILEQLVPASSDITAMLVAIGAASTPIRPRGSGVEAGLGQAGHRADLTAVEAARATRYLLHASPSTSNPTTPFGWSPAV